MPRVLIAALLLANLVFFAWTQGWLDSVVGTRAIGDREPERMQRQFRPETVRILPSEVSLDAAPPALACFEAGPFDEAELGAAQAAAQAALPAGSWTTLKVDEPGAWIVYMGRYASRDAQTKKEDELKRRQVPYDEVGEPAALAPGLSLGRFEQQSEAAQALEQFTQQGIRTARVVALSPPSTRNVLRVEQADAALAARIAGLASNAIVGKRFAACTKRAGT